MNLLSRLSSVCAGLALFIPLTMAAEPAPPSAQELASRLSAIRQDGTSFVRLRMEIKSASGEKTVLQLQIKARCTKSATDLVYQVLWPKERKGEAVLLRKAGNHPASGTLSTLPGTVRSLEASQMKEPLFGSNLALEDIVENFFAWEQQAIVGTEVVDRVNYQILESKPGKSGHSSYASVRTWVDTRRLVPLRIEKYAASGQLARRIDTTRVVTDDKGRAIPANLTVRGRGDDSATELDGSRIRHDVTYADRDFTPDGLKDLAAPGGAPSKD